jgi:hypothetical protein
MTEAGPNRSIERQKKPKILDTSLFLRFSLHCVFIINVFLIRSAQKNFGGDCFLNRTVYDLHKLYLSR